MHSRFGTTGGIQSQILTPPPPNFLGPGGGSPGYPNIHTSKWSPRRADHFEHTYVGVLGVRSQQPEVRGAAGGGRSGVKIFFLFCMHV